MFPIILLAALAFFNLASTSPVANAPINRATVPVDYTAGFKNPVVAKSSGGAATCVSGFISVETTAQNIHLNLAEPANQTVVTDFFTELFEPNSPLPGQLIGAESTVSGTYNVYSCLCYPNGGIDTSKLQLLTHGAGFDHTYWIAAPSYSYVDYAAEQGYTTFLYDRIGVGQSDHPDPIQTVQLGLHTAIAHSLVQLLRTGGIASTTFERVVGVGHSIGSFTTFKVTQGFPQDFDAVVLTGYSDSTAGFPVALTALDFTIASQDQPRRFPSLPNAYLVPNNVTGIRTFFFHAPQFAPALLQYAVANKQTFTMGELLSLLVPPGSATYTGPVDIVDGLNDLPVCDGNCLSPQNLALAAGTGSYPNVADNNFSYYFAPGTGHAVDLHYTAHDTFVQIHDFLSTHGF